MKKVGFIFCFILLFILAGCVSNPKTLEQGTYYCTNVPDKSTQYIHINLTDSTFYIGGDTFSSYREQGTIKVENGKLFASSEASTYVFEIKNNKTLILIENAETFPLYLHKNAKFILKNEDFKNAPSS